MKNLVLVGCIATLASTVLAPTGAAQCEQKLRASDGAPAIEFGAAVAMEGERLLVGASNAGTGAVYVFERSSGIWAESAKLTASGGSVGDRFGSAVDLDGNVAVVAAPADGPGSVYVFVHNAAGWSQAQRLTASDGASGDRFGASVSVDGGTILVGAEGDDDQGSASGSAYVFVRSGAAWFEYATLLASDGVLLDHFGDSASISGTTAFIGAPDNEAAGLDAGAAYVFERKNRVWIEMQKLVATGAAHSHLGRSVLVAGDDAMV